MGDNITDAFLLQFRPDDQITGYLQQIAQQAAKGITLEIDSDVSDVLKDIDKIAKALNDAMAQSGTFDFNKLFDLKTSLAKLGELSKTVGGLKEIFGSLNETTGALTKSMTQIASLKLDAGQFKGIKDSLDKIDTTLTSISDKLAGVDDLSGLKEVKKQADAAGESIEKAAQKQEELNKVQAKQPEKKQQTTTASQSQNKIANTVEKTTKAVSKQAQQVTVDIKKEQRAIEEASNKIADYQSRLDKLDTNKTLANVYRDNIKNQNYGVDLSKITKVKAMLKTVTSEIATAEAELSSTTDLYAKQSIQDNINYLKRVQLELQTVVDGRKTGSFDKDAYHAKVQELHVLHEKSEQFYADEIKQAQAAIKYNEDLIAQKKKLIETVTVKPNTNTVQQVQGQKEAVKVAQPMQKAAEAASTAAANTARLNQEIVEAAAHSEALEQNMAEVNARAQQTVTGKVDIGNTVAITSDGGQLALEKTLKATYHIQQNMVKIMAEINSKMVSGAQAATASYEQLKAVMQETVETAKKLGAEEQKEAAKKGSGKSEYYTRLKQTYAEVLKIMKRLPQAGEKETAILERNLKNAKERIRYNQKQIKDRKLVNKAEEEIVQSLQKQLELQKAINEDKAAKVAKKAEKAVEKTSANNDKVKDPLEEYQALRKKMFGSAVTPLKNIIDVGADENLSKVITKMQTVDDLIAKTGGDGKSVNDHVQQELKETIDLLTKLQNTANSEAIKKGALNAFNTGSGQYAGTFRSIGEASKDDVAILKAARVGSDEYRDALIRLTEAATGYKLENAQLDESNMKLKAEFTDQNKNIKQLTASYQELGNGMRTTEKITRPYKSFASEVLSPISKKMKELMTYFSSFMVIMRVINFVKEGVSTIRELNTALTELKVVTGESSAAIEKFEKSAQKVASSIASTTLEVTQSATEWARLGYTMAESLELAEEAAKYSKVGFTDIGTATENLTSTLQAFYADDIRKGIISAGDAAAEITDKLVYVGNKFASSAEGMGQGITAAGAALVAANNSLDESLAMITAGIVCLNCMETYYYRTRQIALSA